MARDSQVERRGWNRKMQSLPVSFREKGVAGERMGKIVDISEKGIGFTARGSIPVGTIVSVRVMGAGHARLYRGEVRWATAISMNGDYRIGVRLTEDEPKPEPAKPPVPAPEAPSPVPAASQERRRFPRRTLKMLVKLQCVTAGIEHEQVQRGGFLVNISKGGLAVVTTRDYAPGSVLEVTMPEGELGPARTLHARVAWSRAGEEAGRIQIGAGFVRLSAAPPPEGI